MNKETIKEEKWMQKSLRQIKYSGQARNQDNKQQQATTTRLKVDPKKNQTNKQTKKKERYIAGSCLAFKSSVRSFQGKVLVCH